MGRQATDGEHPVVGTDTPSDREPIAGRYTLEHIVGAGATAIVYEGSDLATDQRVAVKVYRPDGAARYLLQQRREIVALTQLRHPGLVALYDGGAEPGPGGRIYLVTELVEGPSLAERLTDGPLDVRSVRDLAARLAAALAHVHACGFIHRDIKPANILLDHDQEPRLADFGIARALDDTIATATGAVPGTAAYLAPEQVLGAPVEPAADVYALGLVLVEALTGRREYPGTAIESATARLHRSPVVPPGLPWNLTALLEAMTDLEPAWRPTAAAVATALATATSPLAPAAAMPAAFRAEAPLASPPARPRPRVRPLGKAPVLVAAAAVGCSPSCLAAHCCSSPRPARTSRHWPRSARPRRRAARSAAALPQYRRASPTTCRSRRNGDTPCGRTLRQ